MIYNICNSYMFFFFFFLINVSKEHIFKRQIIYVLSHNTSFHKNKYKVNTTWEKRTLTRKNVMIQSSFSDSSSPGMILYQFWTSKKTEFQGWSHHIGTKKKILFFLPLRYSMLESQKKANTNAGMITINKILFYNMEQHWHSNKVTTTSKMPLKRRKKNFHSLLDFQVKSPMTKCSH